MKRYLYACAPVVALLLAGNAARADPSTPDQVQWTYNFAPGAPAVTADGNVNAGVNFTNDLLKSATGTSDIVATNLRTFVAPGSPLQLFSTSGAYSLGLTLSTTDSNGVHAATLTFTGKLGGNFSAENSNVTNTYGASQSQMVSLGNWNFTVSLNPFTPPGPPDQSQSGAISAHVAISTLSVTSTTPEPSTMLLSGLGMSFLGLASWRKRRAKARLALAA